MPVLALAYLSQAVQPFAPLALGNLLLDARTFNAQVQVSGVLLHRAGQFFQYIEGPQDGVDAVYARVCASRRHRDIVELFRQSQPKRLFGAWHMGFAEPPTSVLQQLANGQWSRALGEARQQPQAAEMLERLQAFWQQTPSTAGSPG